VWTSLGPWKVGSLHSLHWWHSCQSTISIFSTWRRSLSSLHHAIWTFAYPSCVYSPDFFIFGFWKFKLRNGGQGQTFKIQLKDEAKHLFLYYCGEINLYWKLNKHWLIFSMVENEERRNIFVSILWIPDWNILFFAKSVNHLDRRKHTFWNGQLGPQYWIGFLFAFEVLYGGAKFRTHDYRKKS